MLLITSVKSFKIQAPWWLITLTLTVAKLTRLLSLNREKLDILPYKHIYPNQRQGQSALLIMLVAAAIKNRPSKSKNNTTLSILNYLDFYEPNHG